ncbi:MAG: ABC transporter transmembrane domain-containing protein, partial [Candidatus Poribacteria bacterium]|nr:ABC transporter transmembrane domain-containing protein [Candidatus Poribacteria bacterium]
MNRSHSGTRFLHYLKSYTFLILLATFCALVIAVGELGYVHILADTIDALKLIERHDFDRNPLTVHYFQLNAIGLDNTLNVQKSVIPFFNGLTFSIATQKEALRLVGTVLAWIFGLVLIKGVFAYLNDFLMRCVGLKLIVRLRNELYHKMVMAPLGTLHQYRLGDLLSRLTDDVRSLQAAIGSTAGVVRALIYVPVFVVVMLVRSFSLTILALLVLPPLGYLINRFGQRIRRTSREIQQQTADLSSQVKETLTGIEIIKSFRAEPKEIQRFTDTTQQQYRLSMQRTRLSAMLPPLVEIISVVGISTV